MFVQTQTTYHRIQNPQYIPYGMVSGVKADIKLRNRYLNPKPCAITKNPDEVSVFALMTFGMPMRELQEGEPVFYDADEGIFVEI